MSIIKVIYVKTQVYAYSYTQLGTMRILVCKCTYKNANINLSNSISLFNLVSFAQ